MGVENAGHEMIRSTDLFWNDKVMYWRIHLVDGRFIEVSDKRLREWLKSVGESVSDLKISYRKFAKYALNNLKVA